MVPVPMVRPVGMIAVETVIEKHHSVVRHMMIIAGMRMIMMAGTGVSEALVSWAMVGAMVGTVTASQAVDRVRGNILIVEAIA